MAPARVDAGMVVRHQRAGDAEILAPAQQAVRVVQAKRQPQQRAHGRQRDVALVPGDAHAQHLLASPLPLADHAVVGNGGRVRAGPRAGEREGRYLLAARQARQVVALLRLGAVVQQQFGRPQRVGHHDRDRQRRRARRQPGDDRRMRMGGEAQSAVFLRNDHAQEPLFLDIGPYLGRQIETLVGDVPVIDQAARLFGLVVEKALFGRAQDGPRIVQQLAPVRAAAEQFAFPPHGPGLQGVALRVRHGGQHLAVGRQDGAAQQGAPQRSDAQQRHGRQRHAQQCDQYSVHSPASARSGPNAVRAGAPAARPAGS